MIFNQKSILYGRRLFAVLFFEIAGFQNNANIVMEKYMLSILPKYRNQRWDVDVE
jgi:hypothetical protein